MTPASPPDRHPRFLSCLTGVLLTVLLAGCSPAFDWREVANESAGYRALFPAKPVTVSREFTIAGEKVSLTLQAATVGTAYFSVGEVPLSVDQQTRAGAIVDALKAARGNNVGAKSTQERTVVAGGQTWQEIRVSGQLQNGAPSLMVGRFSVQPGRVIEVLVMGEQAQLSTDVVDQWLGGVQVMQMASAVPNAAVPKGATR